MPHDLPKAYEPGTIEPRWAEYWVREKLFHVDTPTDDAAQETFTGEEDPQTRSGGHA